MERFIIWYLQRKLNKVRKLNKSNWGYEIKGTGKDYPKYLLYTDNENVRKQLLRF